MTRHAHATCSVSRSIGEEAVRYGNESAAAEYLSDRTDIEMRDPHNWMDALNDCIDLHTPVGLQIIQLLMVGDECAAAALMAAQVRPWCKQVAEDEIAKEADVAAREWDGA